MPQSGEAAERLPPDDDRPLERVVPGDVPHPRRRQCGVHDCRAEEHQWQRDQLRDPDQRGLLPGEQRHRVRERREHRGEQHRPEEQHDDSHEPAVEAGAREPGDRDDHEALDDREDRLVDQRRRHQAGAAGRRGEEPVHDAAVHVLDVGRAGPGAAEQRHHHDDAGREELQIAAVVAESRDVDDRLEQLPEQQQPDDRLDEVDDEEGRHASGGPQLARGEEGGVGDVGGHAFSRTLRTERSAPAWALAKVWPVCRR